MNALVSLILAVSLLLGGATTVAAAQDDLPTQPLYPLKLWTENVALAMKGDPQDQANLLMTMAQSRVQEMAALVEQDITPPDQIRERLQQHLDQFLMLAAGMDEATRNQLLLQLREQLQKQDRIIEQLQTYNGAETQPLLTQTRQMLQIHLRLIDEGLADPQGFQYMMNNQMQYGQDDEATPEPNQQGKPGFHQNDDSGNSPQMPGTGNGSQNGSTEGNDAPSNPNPEKPQDGNNGGSSNESPGRPNPNSLQSGNGLGSGNENGYGAGEGGGNK